MPATLRLLEIYGLNLPALMLRRDTRAFTVFLAALTAVGPLTTDMYLPSLIDIGRLLQATAATTQLTLSVYLAGFAVSQIVYGPLSDRFGRKPVLLVALTIYGASSLLCAAAPSIGFLIAGRALQAIGASGCIVLARAIVRDLYEGRRAGRELALMAAVMAFAPMIGPVIGGLVHVAFGWRSLFFVNACIGLAMFAIAWFALRETAPKNAITSRFLGMVRTFAPLLRHAGFVSHLAIIALCFAGVFAWISGSSFVLQDLYRLNEVEFGLAFAIAAVGLLIGTSLAARLVYRLGFDRTMGIGAVALLVGGVAMASAVALRLSSAASLVLPMAVYLMGVGLVLPQATAAALNPFPERAGAASALVGFSQMMFSAFVGAGVGRMLGESAWPLAGTIAAMGAATLLVWFVTRRARRTPKGV